MYLIACGGQITSLGQTIQTPGYPSHYAGELSCSWQIIIPNKKFKLKFEGFHTQDSHDTLEAWSSISQISSKLIMISKKSVSTMHQGMHLHVYFI